MLPPDAVGHLVPDAIASKHDITTGATPIRLVRMGQGV